MLAVDIINIDGTFTIDVKQYMIVWTEHRERERETRVRDMSSEDTKTPEDVTAETRFTADDVTSVTTAIHTIQQGLHALSAKIDEISERHEQWLSDIHNATKTAASDTVTFRVSGNVYEIPRSVLSQFPSTYFGAVTTFPNDTVALYISPAVFSKIVSYLYSKEPNDLVGVPSDITDYFGLPHVSAVTTRYQVRRPVEYALRLRCPDMLCANRRHDRCIRHQALVAASDPHRTWYIAQVQSFDELTVTVQFLGWNAKYDATVSRIDVHELNDCVGFMGPTRGV